MATFHMSGLASGQDTQSIIDAMIKAKSVPLTTMAKEEMEIEDGFGSMVRTEHLDDKSDRFTGHASHLGNVEPNDRDIVG